MHLSNSALFAPYIQLEPLPPHQPPPTPSYHLVSPPTPSSSSPVINPSKKLLSLHLHPYRYPKDYRNAYMHLSNPALFAPYVRLELLRWDPLFADSPSPGAAPASATPSTLSASTPSTSTPGLGAGAGDERAGGAGAGAGADTPAPAARFDSLHWYEALFDFGQDPDATEGVGTCGGKAGQGRDRGGGAFARTCHQVSLAALV